MFWMRVGFILCCFPSWALAVESVRLTDVVKSSGSGTIDFLKIDFLKDVTIEELEQLRLENGGKIVLGVDVNESANGTEKASSQAVTLGNIVVTVTYSDGDSIVYDLAGGCCETETSALLAKSGESVRSEFYTLLGESGSSRITANNQIQNDFDSTISIVMSTPLIDPYNGNTAVSVVAQISWQQTNVALGDPEQFYDFTNGFEDLALLNAIDSEYINSYQAGRDEAVAVIVTNPPSEPDPMEVVNWNYFPSANSFYLVGYEDLYPRKGDYDFNDLTVAYRVRFGMNASGQVVSIRGTAHLLTRGAGYNHNWNLRIPLPAGVESVSSCTTYLNAANSYALKDCAYPSRKSFFGTADIQVFSQTYFIFKDSQGSFLANTLPGQNFVLGPKSLFRLDFSQPVSASDIGAAPFDPYLQVLNTGESVQLLQVNPDFRDPDGYPFGMLMPLDWTPPLEYESISQAYPNFDNFVASQGQSNADWYAQSIPARTINMPGMGIWAW